MSFTIVMSYDIRSHQLAIRHQQRLRAEGTRGGWAEGPIWKPRSQTARRRVQRSEDAVKSRSAISARNALVILAPMLAAESRSRLAPERRAACTADLQMPNG
jgi:hypothetical protein